MDIQSITYLSVYHIINPFGLTRIAKYSRVSCFSRTSSLKIAP